MRAIVLKFGGHQDHPGSWLKHRSSDSWGWDPRLCISNEFPDGAGTTLREPHNIGKPFHKCALTMGVPSEEMCILDPSLQLTSWRSLSSPWYFLPSQLILLLLPLRYPLYISVPPLLDGNLLTLPLDYYNHILNIFLAPAACPMNPSLTLLPVLSASETIMTMPCLYLKSWWRYQQSRFFTTWTSCPSAPIQHETPHSLLHLPNRPSFLTGYQLHRSKHHASLV